MTLLAVAAVILLVHYKGVQAGCIDYILPTSSPDECDEMSVNKSDKVGNILSNISDADYANTSTVEEPHLLLPSTVSINGLLSVICLFLNLIIITFYWSNSPNLSSILYLRNAIADSISAAGFLLQVTLIIRVLEEDFPPCLPLISYCITTVSVRMSVFMNCVLGVVRCINILNPFYQVKKKWVSISVCSYFLIWSTITSLDIGM